jgi:hypothetical protein
MNNHYISARARPRISWRPGYLLEHKDFRMCFVMNLFYAAAHLSTIAWLHALSREEGRTAC